MKWWRGISAIHANLGEANAKCGIDSVGVCICLRMSSDEGDWESPLEFGLGGDCVLDCE
jgi:hypothetical protein